MVRHSLKIMQQMVQDFLSVSEHFGTLCIKGLKNTFKKYTFNENLNHPFSDLSLSSCFLPPCKYVTISFQIKLQTFKYDCITF